MGFFHWIREGVRQAVLLGVSDAVTEIGNRQPDEDLGEHLAAALRQNLTVETAAKPASATMPAGACSAWASRWTRFANPSGRDETMKAEG